MGAKDSPSRPLGMVNGISASVNALTSENDRLRARVAELEARLTACGCRDREDDENASD